MAFKMKGWSAFNLDEALVKGAGDAVDKSAEMQIAKNKGLTDTTSSLSDTASRLASEDDDK